MTLEYKLNESIKLLQQIVSIPSYSKQEHEVSDILYKYICQYNLPVKRIGNNILIIDEERYKNTPTILLNSHIDTVKPVQSWTRDPFKPDIIQDRLYGLGTNDAGASLICLLMTAIDMFNKQKYNIAFCASAEEEISGANGISRVIDDYPTFDLAIVGEPTQMQPAVAEKGLMVLDCKSYGKAGHAARNEGDNAIYKALNDIAWFKNYSFPKKSPFLGEVKMSVTQITAGTQHNVIPAECSFVVDIRGNGCYSNNEILKIIKDNVLCTITARSTRLNSSMISSDHKVFNTFKKLNMRPFGSPTLSDQALMSFPSIKIGPGFSGRSHSADEFIYISEIKDALIKYELLLNNLIL